MLCDVVEARGPQQMGSTVCNMQGNVTGVLIYTTNQSILFLKNDRIPSFKATSYHISYL